LEVHTYLQVQALLVNIINIKINNSVWNDPMIDKKIIFKTPAKYAKKQISAATIFVLIFIWVTIDLSYNSINEFQSISIGELLIRIIALFSLVFSLLMIFYIIFFWFSCAYTLVLDGNTIKGYNLFNRGKEFRVDDLIEIKLFKVLFGFGKLPYYCDHQERKLMIIGDMDYEGFINDYILDQIADRTNINHEVMSKINSIRSNGKTWLYTRRDPFTTEYEDGYLEWLLPVVEKQKQRMIEKGILRDDIFYGDKGDKVVEGIYQRWDLPDFQEKIASLLDREKKITDAGGYLHEYFSFDNRQTGFAVSLDDDIRNIQELDTTSSVDDIVYVLRNGQAKSDDGFHGSVRIAGDSTKPVINLEYSEKKESWLIESIVYI